MKKKLLALQTTKNNTKHKTQNTKHKTIMEVFNLFIFNRKGDCLFYQQVIERVWVVGEGGRGREMDSFCFFLISF